jgi:TRAP-type C4-dicarboxylate transport system permease large subunit
MQIARAAAPFIAMFFIALIFITFIPWFSLALL